jgi:hypothetical protein
MVYRRKLLAVMTVVYSSNTPYKEVYNSPRNILYQSVFTSLLLSPCSLTKNVVSGKKLIDIILENEY